MSCNRPFEFSGYPVPTENTVAQGLLHKANSYTQRRSLRGDASVFPQATSGISLILLENLVADPSTGGEILSSGLNSVDPHNLGLKFLQIARHRGQAPLVTTNDATYSYSSLGTAALSLSHLIRSSNTVIDTCGERVILLLPNSPEYITSFYGVLLAGRVVVPVAPKIEAETLRRIIETTDAKFIITTPNILRTRPDLQSIPAQAFESTNEIAGDEKLSACLSPNTDDANDDNRLAAIFFTGGSSGTPKGVMLSHRNLMSNADSIRQYLDITESDNPLCILPFMHAFGNSVMQSHILAGARLTIAGNTAFPQTIVTGLKDHACTSLSGVPDLFRMLMSRSSLGRTPLGNLRYMAVAGGALPQQHAQELAEKIAPSRFFVMYGQTEATARLAYVPPELLHVRPDGAIGQPVPGVTLEIVNQNGSAVAAGEIGELRARGPNIMLGYWRDTDATSERIRDGWLYTGDLATRDENNWIVLRGRSSSFVKIAGFRVHPQELEEFAVRRFGADQAVAVPFDGSIGTRLGLFLKLRPESKLELSEIISTCRADLPHYLTPEVIQIVDDFPLNHAMKIDRPALEKLAQQALSQRRISA